MSTTLFSAFGILAPMHGFLRRFGTANTPAGARLKSPRTGTPSLASSPLPGRQKELALMPIEEPAHRSRSRVTARSRNRENLPLRVVRVMETGQAAAHVGRMMMSGRMADVCAELDRMSEREAKLRVGV